MTPLRWHAARQEDLPRGVAWLTVKEREALARFTVPKRRSDWLLGRWAAALGALIEDPERIAALSRHARADSEPYTWLARAQRALAGLPLEGK